MPNNILNAENKYGDTKEEDKENVTEIVTGVNEKYIWRVVTVWLPAKGQKIIYDAVSVTAKVAYSKKYKNRPGAASITPE